MKSLKLGILLMAVVGMTACVGDLNTSPIDKNSATAFNQDAVFSKCYATLALTGQKGPDGDCDIDDLDEGTSSFYRMMWELNEFCSDEGWWIWNDVGLADIRVMNWNGDNALVKGLYYRLNIDIKLCNHFLEYASTDDKGMTQRAEIRFIRALNYWYMLDMFKVAPLSTKESTDLPEFVERDSLYTWLVNELDTLTEILPEQRLSTYRVDKYAAWLLLARTYLNAEVYTGNEMVALPETRNSLDSVSCWVLAEEAAKEAQKGNYKLLTNETISKDGVRYSAYQKLFMGDNHSNGAQDEALLLVYQDGVYCQCWGGSRFVISATRDAGFIPWGSSDSWKCFRSSPELVYKFAPKGAADTIKANEYQMPIILGDDRAILCSQSDSNKVQAWKLSGPMSAEFYDCWSVIKFTGVYSTADHPAKNVGSDASWPDTDIPLMRLAEAYMIEAEALFRQGKTADALNIINNVIRKRANAAPLTKLDETTLCDEWCREFFTEGRRRTDLIRFNRFAGPQADANAYSWEGRAGVATNTPYVTMPEKWNWYPIPNDDKASNENYYKTNGDGYDS